MRQAGYFDEAVAESVAPLSEMLDLQAFMERSIPPDEDTDLKEAVDDVAKQVRQTLTAAAAAGRALKKGGNDIKSALQAHKTSEKLRQGVAEKAGAKPKKSKMSSYAATSDPSAPWP